MPSPSARRRSSFRAWLSLVLAVATLFLAAWIFLPPPNVALLTLAVGAPEISQWLGVAALVALWLARPRLRADRVARVAAACAMGALGCAASVFVRFPATARSFDAELRAATGGDPLRSVPGEIRATLRPSALSVSDLFRGIAPGAALVDSNVPLGSPDGVPLTLDIYRPLQRGRYPLVAQIYGGSWQRGAPGADAAFARWLAAQGYVVVALDYRHAPQYQWPAQMDDIRAGLTWIRERAGRYGVDTSRVAIIGRSAGAQLALMAAWTPGPLTIRAVISYYGPADLSDAYRNPPRPDPLHIRGIQEAFLGGTPDEDPDGYRDASPIAHVAGALPATLLIQGRRDNIVEPRYGRALRDSLRAAGSTVAYLEIPWAEHAFDMVFNGPSSQLALYNVQRFLAWAMARSAGPG